MLETPHVVVGAAIASKIGNPYLALPLALASHFILDIVPHWNPHLNKEIIKYGKVTKQSKFFVYADSILALIFGFSIASRTLPNTNHALLIILASFISVLPDVIEGPYYFFKFKSLFIENWIRFQKSIQNDTSIIPGLLTQLATVITAIWWITS